MNIRFAENGDFAAVARLNSRLIAAGSKEIITMHPNLPGESRYRPEGFPVYRRMMVANDGEEVRAAMLLYHHNVFVHGKKRDFCWVNMPLSEGIINPKYSLAIVQLMKKAVDYQPFLMALGVGTEEYEIHRFLVKLKWRHSAVPFFFYPLKFGRVLRELNYFEKSSKLHYAALLGSYSGIGAGVSALLAMHRRFTAAYSGYLDTVVNSFDDWADDIFTSSLPDYPVAIRSDAACLNILYPPDDHRFVRLRVKRKGTKEDAGWIVVASAQMNNSPHFGNLKVGTLVDGFGRSADVPALVSAGIKHLVRAGVDIIVANFSHAAWTRACRRAGMFSGPSSYYTFVASGGSPLLEESCPSYQFHLTRGHSDGMTFLL